jgi:hypothetical protein
MREIYKGGVTPQQKLVAVNNKFGNVNVKNQQGTSRIIYDSIQVTAGKTFYRFFEDSTTRAFPLTNTGSEGNKLGVGDTMVVNQILFSVWTKTIATGVWASNGNLLLSVAASALGLLDLDIANNKVIKKLTLTEAEASYNKDTTTNANVIDLETQIVIPPLLQYTLDLQLPIAPSAAAAGTEKYIVCQLIGTGGIIAPRTTF